jgi:hypothetical protein
MALAEPLASRASVFRSTTYRSINARRLEHLAALRLPLFNRSVLEVGAGVGDLTSFFTDRGCTVTATDGRQGNVALLAGAHPNLESFRLDLDDPGTHLDKTFDLVFCYGTLYHLSRPEDAIGYLSARCGVMMLLETCVSFGTESRVEFVSEAPEADQALHRVGCRPTRSWVYKQLERNFDFVYVPTVQPAHPEFPTDWRTAPATPLTRAVFVASRQPLVNPLLSTSLPQTQAPV